MTDVIRNSIVLTLAAAWAAVPVSAQVLELGPTESLARLYNPRFKTFVRASSDPNDFPTAPSLGNDDGFSGLNQVDAYAETVNLTRRYSVLAHYEGRPGFVGSFFRNFWGGFAGIRSLPWENTRGQIIVEGVPYYDLPLLDYFRPPTDPSGQIAPFDGLMTQSRAGGNINFTPIVFEDSMKLRVADNWFNNASRFYRVSGTLGTWDDVFEVPSKADWETVASIAAAGGGWPHATPRTNVVNTMLTIPAGQSQRIALVGPGAVLELTCTVGAPSDWEHLQAEFTFDGAGTPQVDAPLRTLGGMVRQPFSAPMATLLMNNDGATRITNYFPMPYKSSADLVFVNNGTQPVTLNVDHVAASGVMPRPWGYYTVTHDFETTQTGVPFDGPTLTDAHGMLRYVGLETSIDNTGNIPGMVSFLHIEGDLCIRINGNKGDDHVYAASETAIGHWGWYDTPSDLPFAADCSFHSGLMSRSLTGAMAGAFETNRHQGSTLVFDPVHFVDGIDIKLEHGRSNIDNANYWFTTMMYVAASAARQEMFELDVGNVGEEVAANVSYDKAAPSYTLTHGFFRDTHFQTPAVTDDVRVIGQFYRFDVSDPTFVNQNAFALGFRLDRDRLGDGGLVQADVFIDGFWAGLLHSSTSNQWFRWKEGGELEVEIPRALTRNKSSFTVELRPRPTSLPLNLARIWLYGY